MAGSDVFILHRAGIEQFFMPLGAIDNIVKDDAQKVMRLAIRWAPARSGHLKAMHSVRRAQTPGSGKYISGYQVVNRASYAYIVHEGTTEFGHPPGGRTIVAKGPSRNPNRLPAMGPIPPHGTHTQRWHHAVSGQGDQPWLSNALARVMLGI